MPIDFTLKIAGEAGWGIASAGLIFAKTAMRSGFSVFDFNEYPSLIRGGHNVVGIRVADRDIHSPLSAVDFLIALDQKTIDLHAKELSSSSVVLVNSDKTELGSSLKSKIFPVPFSKLAAENNGQELFTNNVALGSTIFLLGGDFSVLESAIRDVFCDLKPEVIEMNVKAARSGFEFAQKNFSQAKLSFGLQKGQGQKRLLLSGNDALCLGAVKAGCRFVAAYPMTPINSLLAFFAAKAKELGLVYYQPEDEIAGICSAIGASLCGVRSMVATSGGGFSLMAEAYGLAGMTETPLVIVEGQRPGPSSGLPTWTGQGDLRFALSASQDDFPRIVLAPASIEECFWQAFDAFNLAERYQTPVVILVDKYLCESHQTVPLPDQTKAQIDRGLLETKSFGYQRYKLTKSGISPRAMIGRPNFSFWTSSYEHDEWGFAREDAPNRKAMMGKRMRKLQTLQEEMPGPSLFSTGKSSLGLISWGSVRGAVLEAQESLRVEGVRTESLSLNFLQPFPARPVREFLQKHKKVLLVEQNISAQLAGLVREKTGLEIEDRLLKYDGRPVFPEEITKSLKEML